MGLVMHTMLGKIIHTLALLYVKAATKILTMESMGKKPSGMYIGWMN
jgi:hypothetical protein